MAGTFFDNSHDTSLSRRLLGTALAVGAVGGAGILAHHYQLAAPFARKIITSAVPQDLLFEGITTSAVSVLSQVKRNITSSIWQNKFVNTIANTPQLATTVGSILGEDIAPSTLKDSKLVNQMTSRMATAGMFSGKALDEKAFASGMNTVFGNMGIGGQAFSKFDSNTRGMLQNAYESSQKFILEDKDLSAQGYNELKVSIARSTASLLNSQHGMAGGISAVGKNLLAGAMGLRPVNVGELNVNLDDLLGSVRGMSENDVGLFAKQLKNAHADPNLFTDGSQLYDMRQLTSKLAPLADIASQFRIPIMPYIFGIEPIGLAPWRHVSIPRLRMVYGGASEPWVGAVLRQKSGLIDKTHEMFKKTGFFTETVPSSDNGDFYTLGSERTLTKWKLETLFGDGGAEGVRLVSPTGPESAVGKFSEVAHAGMWGKQLEGISGNQPYSYMRRNWNKELVKDGDNFNWFQKAGRRIMGDLDLLQQGELSMLDYTKAIFTKYNDPKGERSLLRTLLSPDDHVSSYQLEALSGWLERQGGFYNKQQGRTLEALLPGVRGSDASIDLWTDKGVIDWISKVSQTHGHYRKVSREVLGGVTVLSGQAAATEAYVSRVSQRGSATTHLPYFEELYSALVPGRLRGAAAIREGIYDVKVRAAIAKAENTKDRMTVADSLIDSILHGGVYQGQALLAEDDAIRLASKTASNSLAYLIENSEQPFKEAMAAALSSGKANREFGISERFVGNVRSLFSHWGEKDKWYVLGGEMSPFGGKRSPIGATMLVPDNPSKVWDLLANAANIIKGSASGDQKVRQQAYNNFTGIIADVGKQYALAGRYSPMGMNPGAAMVYHMANRLNTMLMYPGLGLGPDSLGSASDIFLKGLIGKRMLPVMAGAIGLGVAANLPFPGVFSPRTMMANAAANVGLAGATISDVLGITDMEKRFQELIPGSENVSEVRSYDEYKEYLENGYAPMRSGRYWILGSGTPFWGSKITGYAPSWYKRAFNNNYANDTYGGYFQSLLGRILPTRFLAPYAAETRNYWHKPYPVTGQLFDETMPLAGLLNMTLGNLIKPSRRMHPEDELSGEGAYMMPSGAMGFMSREQVGRYKDYFNRAAPRSAATSYLYENAIKFIRNLNQRPVAVYTGGGGLSMYEIGDPFEEEIGVSGGAPGPGGGEGGGRTTGGEYARDTVSGPEIVAAQARVKKQLSARRKAGGNSGGGMGADSDASVEAVRSYANSLKGAAAGKSSLSLGHIFRPRVNEQIAGTPSVDPNSMQYNFGAMLYSAGELSGIYGFLSQTFFGGGMSLGSSRQPVLQPASRMYSWERSFWGMNIGGLGGELNELVRRFIPHIRREQYEVNTIKNDMPDWIPGKNYYLNLQEGDPYNKVKYGDFILPGRNGHIGQMNMFERLLHNSDATALERFEVLALAAPYSAETDYYSHILARDRLMTPEGKQRYKYLKSLITKRRKDSWVRPYKFKGRKDDLETREYTVAAILDPNTILTNETPHPLRLAGVRFSDAAAQEAVGKSAIDVLAEMGVAPGARILGSYDKTAGIADDKYQTIRAVISVPSSLGAINVNKQLLESGLAKEKENDFSAPGVEVRFNEIEQQSGSMFEKLAHLDIPLIHAKFFPVNSPLEEFERRHVFGAGGGDWTSPVSSFLAPTVDSFASKSWFAAPIAGAYLGGMFFASQKTRTAAMGVGAAYMTTVSAYRKMKSMITGEEWIPERTQKRYELYEYKDRLEYIKYKRLYQAARMQAITAAGMDPEVVAKKLEKLGSMNKQVQNDLFELTREVMLDPRILKHLSDESTTSSYASRLPLEVRDRIKELTAARTSLQKLRLAEEIAPEVAYALSLKGQSNRTVYGQVTGDKKDFAALLGALPNEIGNTMEHMPDASPEERKRFYSLLSPYYQAAVAPYINIADRQKPSTMRNYFKHYMLPNAGWGGWEPDTTMDAAMVAIADNTGMNPVELGIYPRQAEALRRQNVEAPRWKNPKLQSDRNSGQVLADIIHSEIMRLGFNRLNVDWEVKQVEGQSDTVEIKANLTTDQLKDIIESLKFKKKHRLVLS